MNHRQHESARLITEAEAIKRQYGKLATQEMEIHAEMRRLERQLDNIDVTFGTVNPGQHIWGSVA